MNNQRILLFFLMPAIIFIFAINICYASLLKDGYADMTKQTSSLAGTAGFDESATVGGVVAVVIEAFLALLGMIFVILIIVSGYNWMTAAGNEEKVTKAKETLARAIIGLIIIVAAYSITYFVLNKLPWGGSSGSGGVSGSP